MRQLPSFDPRRRAASLLIAYALFCLLYVGSGQLALRPARELPRLWLDRGPYLGWTLWVYLSHLLFLPGALCLLREPENFDRTLKAMLAATAVSAACFFIFPTRLPQADWRVAPEGLRLYETVAAVFEAVNTRCFPSLHVALAFLAAAAVHAERPRLGWTAFAWAAAIAASTVTAKQHYALDVAAGLVLVKLGSGLASTWRVQGSLQLRRGLTPTKLSPWV